LRTPDLKNLQTGVDGQTRPEKSTLTEIKENLAFPEMLLIYVEICFEFLLLLEMSSSQYLRLDNIH